MPIECSILSNSQINSEASFAMRGIRHTGSLRVPDYCNLAGSTLLGQDGNVIRNIPEECAAIRIVLQKCVKVSLTLH